ncbi:MAG TPA: 4-hydroxythreonine-4-phosphate dehydrogenase PdxA, partial [Fibrobacteria bacterium]|nr:4-hydroxythreonine-4-phosphate dehydrogenase PdxA [Fibrobacteria bacterium]
MQKPILVTLGDPNGVGPRIVARALQRPSIRRRGIVVVGDASIYERALREEGSALPVVRWTPGSPVAPGTLAVREPPGLAPGELEPGRISAWAGGQSLLCVDDATDLCVAFEARAMVTAPLSKESVDLVLPGFSGHTGHIARRTGAPSHCLTLVHDGMWVSFVTTHIPLKDVPAAITTESVLQTARLLHGALVDAGVASPRIGIAGLNPHAGEHGLFGDEEALAVEPAVARCRLEGLDATGPWPADVVFPMLKARRLDGVVSLYHDQGHPVMKTLAFDFRRGKVRGVNATL